MFSKEEVNFNVIDKILKGIYEISKSVKKLVVVSDYVFGDSIEYDKFTEGFRKNLGVINREIATKSDIVCESLYENIIIYKGEELLKYEKLI